MPGPSRASASSAGCGSKSWMAGTSPAMTPERRPASDTRSVMPGLEPGIHVFYQGRFQVVDGRDKPGHDDSVRRWLNDRSISISPPRLPPRSVLLRSGPLTLTRTYRAAASRRHHPGHRLSLRIAPCSGTRSTKSGAVIDPGGDLARVMDAVEANGVEVEKIVLTHGHIDHAGGAAELKERLGVPIEGPHRADSFLLERLVDSGRSAGIAGSRNVTPGPMARRGRSGDPRRRRFRGPALPRALAGQRRVRQPRSALRDRGRRAFPRLGRTHRSSARRPSGLDPLDQDQLHPLATT